MWPVEGNPGAAPALDRPARWALLAGGAGVLLAVVAATIVAIHASGPAVPAYSAAGTGVARLWVGGSSGFHELPATSRGPRSNHVDLAFDAGRGVVVAWDHGCARLVMGFTGGCGEEVDQTWTWDGRAWREMSTSTQPASSGAGVMGYDDTLRAVIYANRAGQAWRWSGSDWSVLRLDPPAEVAHGGSIAIGFDRGGGLLFVTSGSTWDWSGTAWQRHSGGIDAADARTDNAQLVAGYLFVGKRYTWMWDGISWRQALQPAFTTAATAYDSRAGTEILLAEDPNTCDRTHCQSATWTWTGAAWKRQGAGPVFPLNGSGAFPPAMVFDPLRDGLDVLVSAA